MLHVVVVVVGVVVGVVGVVVVVVGVAVVLPNFLSLPIIRRQPSINP
jgi:hypothetical protein